MSSLEDAESSRFDLTDVPPLVIAGLDPAIHEALPLAPSKLLRPMDAHVTPGHDEMGDVTIATIGYRDF